MRPANQTLLGPVLRILFIALQDDAREDDFASTAPERTIGDRRRSSSAPAIEAVRNSHITRELQFFVRNASGMPIYEAALTRPSDASEDYVIHFIGLALPGQTIQRPAPAHWLSEHDSPESPRVEFTHSSGAA